MGTTIELLEFWLLLEEPKEKVEVFQRKSAMRGVLSSWTDTFLAYGAPEGSWNLSLFNSSCDMTRAGYSLEEIMDRMQNITGTLDSKDRATIKSAYKTARNQL